MKRRRTTADARAVSPPDDRFMVRGRSMWFLLRQDDVIFVERPAASAYRRGDVVLLLDAAGPHYVVHRLLAVRPTPAGPMLRTKGDWTADWDSEKWAPVGRMIAFERHGLRVPWEGAGVRTLSALFFVYARALFAAARVYSLARRGVWEAFWNWSTGRFAPARPVFRFLSVWMEPAAQRLEGAAVAAAQAAADAMLAVFIVWRGEAA